MKLSDFQTAHREWSLRNFGETTELKIFHCYTGIAEECGELADALFDMSSSDKIKDAIGDICIYVCDLCSRSGWSLAEMS